MLGITWKKPWNEFSIWLHHNILWTTLRYNSVTCERRYGKMIFKCICKNKWLRIKETFLKKKYKVKGLFFFFNQKLAIYCYLCFFRWSGIRCRGIHIDQQNRKESSDADQYQKWKFDLWLRWHWYCTLFRKR